MDSDVLSRSSFDPETDLITCLFAWQDGHALDIAAIPQIKLAPEGKGTQSLAIRTGQSILLTDYNAPVSYTHLDVYKRQEREQQQRHDMT